MLPLPLPLILLVLTGDSTARARSAVDSTTPRWHTSATAGGERFSADQSIWKPWLFFQATAQRRIDGGSMQLETQRTRRFGQWDQSYAADVYHTLGRTTYVNVRVLATPAAKILPRTDVAATIYQALPAGWEMSAGGRHMEFAAGNASVVAAGAGRSFGEYYARVRGSALTTRGGGASLDAMIRKSPNEDRLIELGANVGREVVSIDAAGGIDVRNASGAYARAQRYVGRTWGVAAQVGTAAQRGIPTRSAAQVTLLARW